MSGVGQDGLYADGSYGHSGSETSEDAGRNVRLGKRQQEILAVVTQRAGYGMTCAEVQQRLVIGHGTASGALSRLHQLGQILRLKERRGRQQVYVIPSWVSGREQSPYRPNAAYRPERAPMALDPEPERPAGPVPMDPNGEYPVRQILVPEGPAFEFFQSQLRMRGMQLVGPLDFGDGTPSYIIQPHQQGGTP